LELAGAHPWSALAGELLAWRQAPLRDKKARKELAKQMVEGPPGPGRTTWKAFEAAAAIISAALARRAVERFLSGEPPAQERRPNAALGAGPVVASAETLSARSDYSSMSSASRSKGT